MYCRLIDKISFSDIDKSCTDNNHHAFTIYNTGLIPHMTFDLDFLTRYSRSILHLSINNMHIEKFDGSVYVDYPIYDCCTDILSIEHYVNSPRRTITGDDIEL